MITRNIIKIMPPTIRKRVENNKELRKIMGNINWLAFENISRNIIGLVIVIFVARYLGPEQFGLMNYAMAFVALFSIFASLGLDDIVVREIVSNFEKRKEYLGTSLFLKFIGSFFLVVFSSIAIYFVEPENNLLQLFVFIYALGYIFKSFDVIDLWFKSQVQSKYSVYAKSISFLTISSLKIIFVFTQAPLIAFVLMLSLDFLLTSLFLIYFYAKNADLPLMRWKVRFSVMKSLLKDSWPLILSGIAFLIYMKIDQVMIGNILGETQLGIYSAAVKISEAWYAIPTIITASVFPAIIHSRKVNRQLYLKRIQILYDFFIWFTLTVALIITFLSPFIIKILYGSDYLGASNVLSIHIWAGVFVFWGVVNGKYLITENLTKMILVFTLSGAFINVLLNIWLIPSLGPVGAAIATLVSQIFSSVIFFAFFEQTRILTKMQFRALNILRVIKYIK